jgi:hypothetical protein
MSRKVASFIYRQAFRTLPVMMFLFACSMNPSGNGG